MSSSLTTIIAGGNGQEQSFYVLKSTLEKSPVLRDWLIDPSSCSPTLTRGDSLYFPSVEPEVLRALLHCLENGPAMGDVTPLFCSKLLKLCLSLAHVFSSGIVESFANVINSLEDLCNLLFVHIENTKIIPLEFVHIAVFADSSKLSENPRFRDWMIQYIVRNLDGPSMFGALQSTVAGGTSNITPFFAVLHTFLTYLSEDRKENRADSMSPASGRYKSC
jgi:hypothetical protein